jgi:ribonuclease Z
MHYAINRDAMPESIASNLQAFSWSFSHFFMWRAFRLMFDCGEGAAIRLDSHVFRAEVLALSHSHSDHCRGLIGFIEARAGLKGDNDKPLTILYPEGSTTMAQWIDPAMALCERRGIETIQFRPIGDGDSFALRNGRELKAIAVPHQPGDTCLAYRIGRTRRRLKPEFRSLPGNEIAALAKTRSKEELEEDWYECELAYSGDTERLDPDFCTGAHVLIHEASFLNPEDADSEKGIHAGV